MTAISLRWTALALCPLLLAACSRESAADASLLGELAPAGGVDAAGVFVSPSGDEIGHVVFKEGPRGVLMRVDLKGLSEGWHGVHLHMTADCSDGADGFKASGGHINPDAVAHGLLNPDGAHRADLPNIYAGADGRATAEIYRADVALRPSEQSAAENGPFPLLDDDGFAVIVHEMADDHQTQPIGGAGGRVACAAISNSS